MASKPSVERTENSASPIWQAIAPIAVLTVLIVYGLVIRKRVLNVEPLPLENIFIAAAAYTIGQLLLTGHRWADVQKSIVNKLAKALPAFFILFSIGLIIGSWMICGTIPMLVYYGLKFVDPRFIYVIAFVAPIVFSTLTGTSWGSVGTIGVVIIGIATAMDAHLGIVAGAIVGGAYFGDKLSPLSDTTNIASLAAEVNVYDHIHSMLFTTVPSAVIAATIYVLAGFIYPPEVGANQVQTAEPFLDLLSSLFQFNVLLLLPPVVVLAGSLRRQPIIPTLFASILTACLLSILFQSFSFADLMNTMHKGFDVNMSSEWKEEVPKPVSSLINEGAINELLKQKTVNEILTEPKVAELIDAENLEKMRNQKRVKTLLNRGGLYALNDAIITALMVFVFIGAMDHIRAMPRVVDRILRFARYRWQTITASLLTTGFVAAMTSNVYASSFIVGDAFKSKYDALKIKRKVLSRSLEDTGTMIETLIPWSLATLYMVDTLGVPFDEYCWWQLLSIINIGVAFFFAVTGIACFYEKRGKSKVATGESE